MTGPGKLSETGAVRAARQALTELDAAGKAAYHPDVLPVWFGRTTEALRLVLTAIDDAERDTP